MINAAEYLQLERGTDKGEVLGIWLSEEVVEVGESGTASEGRRTVMVFEAAWCRIASVSPVRTGSKHLIVGAKTNPAQAAGAIAHAVRQESDDMPVVLAMGSTAMHQALIALSSARRFLHKEGRGEDFIVTPAFEEKESQQPGASGHQSGGKPVKQLVLKLMRVAGDQSPHPEVAE